MLALFFFFSNTHTHQRRPRIVRPKVEALVKKIWEEISVCFLCISLIDIFHSCVFL